MVMTAVRRANFEHGGAASSDLRQFLLLGHASDLKFYGAQRVLTGFQTSDPHMILISFALSRLRSCMKDLNCTEGTLTLRVPGALLVHWDCQADWLTAFNGIGGWTVSNAATTPSSQAFIY